MRTTKEKFSEYAAAAKRRKKKGENTMIRIACIGDSCVDHYDLYE